MKVTKENIAEWSLNGIVGGIALTILMSFVSVVTGSWNVIAPFVGSHLLESLACAAVVLGVGIIIGATICYLRNKNQLATKDAEITELKNDEPPILTGEQALNFVRSLTDNQHTILKEMFDNGGTILADPLDGDMQQLLSYHMVERPAMFAPGVETKWTLPPNINMMIRNNPEVLETKEETRRRIANAELDKFSVAQLDLMVRIVDACDETGSLHIPLSSQDGKTASQLIEQLVAMSGDWDGSGYGWYLLPDWNKFVKRNRAEIDKRTEEIRSKRDNDARKKAEEEEEESRKQRQTVAPCINFGDPANLK